MLRLLLASLRGMLERLVYRIMAFAAALACIALVAVLVATLTGRALVSHAEGKLDRRWRQTLEPLETLPQTEPPRDANPTARKLEAMAAAIGIDLVPAQRDGAGRPEADAAARFEVFAEILDHWTRSLLHSTDTAPDVPPDLARLLAENSGQLDELTSLLLGQVPPRWECDVTAGYQAPLPNFDGLRRLHQLLAAGAVRRASRGDREGADAMLQASWHLNQPILARPERSSVLFALEPLEVQLAVLHLLEPPPAGWQERLTGLDLAASYLRTLRTEAFNGLLAARQGLAADTSNRWWRYLVHPLAQPLERQAMLRHAENMRLVVEELPGQDMRRFRPGEHLALLQSRIPRWNVPARLALPPVGDDWQRVVHAALILEMESRRLQAHELASAGALDALVAMAGVSPSPLGGFAWRYKLEPDRLVITLAGGSWSPPGSALEPLSLRAVIAAPDLPGAEEDDDAA